MTTQAKLKKIEELRDQYRETVNPVDRKIIEARGKLLKWSMEKNGQRVML